MELITKNYIDEFDYSKLQEGNRFYYIDDNDMNVIVVKENIGNIKYVLSHVTFDEFNNANTVIEEVLIIDNSIINYRKASSSDYYKFTSYSDRAIIKMLSSKLKQHIDADDVLFYSSHKNSDFEFEMDWYYAVMINPETYIVVDLTVKSNGKYNIIRKLRYFLYDYKSNAAQQILINKDINLLLIISNHCDPELLIKMQNVISTSEYSFKNFINNTPPDKFKNLLRDVNIDYLFEPLFQHNTIKFYCDYQRSDIVCYSNENEVKLLTFEYKRIKETLYDHICGYCLINPLTGEPTDGCNVVYEDAESVIVENYDTTHTYIKIYDVYVIAAKSEEKEIDARRKVFNTLSTSNDDFDADDMW